MLESWLNQYTIMWLAIKTQAADSADEAIRAR